jgi:hypothetical protein
MALASAAYAPASSAAIEPPNAIEASVNNPEIRARSIRSSLVTALLAHPRGPTLTLPQG